MKFLKSLLHKRPFLLPASLLLLLFLSVFTIWEHQPLSEDSRFHQYTQELFKSEVCGNTLSLHYTLANPAGYGIKDYPITLGNLSSASHLAAIAQIENYQTVLNSFARNDLTPSNQLTYDILTEYLKTELEGANYYLYQEPLSPTLGIQAQLPVLLAEYTFRTRQDIEDYLALLTCFPDYFSSIADFEKEKAAAGLFMNDACVKEILEQCNDFIQDKENNYLRQVFEEQIDAFTNLTADEKISYKRQNVQILEAYVIPAYQELMNQLAKLLGSGKHDGGLAQLPEGKAYYQYLVHSKTGDARPIEDIEARIKKEIISVYQDIQELIKSSAGKSSGALTQAALGEPAQILSGLQTVITSDFPTLPAVSCQVKYVPEALQAHLSPAFYLVPPIDHYQENVIYINPASDYNALELYTTLAHEGYPGHLYQTVTFESKNQVPLRSILDFGGYVEGWATYVEMYAYQTWSEDPQLAALYQKDRSFMLGLASLLDIGIHYRGYSRAEVQQFLSNFGIKEQSATSLYNTILESPGNYLKYYVGYLNFMDLKDYLQGKLGNKFSLKEYHARVLSIGPSSFAVLKEYLTNAAYLGSLAAE